MDNKLLDFLRSWKLLGHIPLLILSKDGQMLYHTEKTNSEKVEKIWEWCREQENTKHKIFVVDNTFAYGLCRDIEERRYVVGPVQMYEYDMWKKRNFEHNSLMWYCSVEELYKSSLSQLKAEFIVLCSAVTGDMVSEDELFEKESIWNLEDEIQEYQFQTVDNEQTRNSYKEVADLLDTLRRGDIEEYFHLQDETLLDRTGKMAKDSYKQMEYLTVKIFSLHMHAIIDGGVDYNKAYDLCDVYLQRLERCANILQIQNLQKEYVLECISMIEEELSKVNEKDIVEKAKQYVRKYRNKKITAREVANALNVNASYLSRRFSEKEHKTLQQFITQEKIKASCNMLRYSDYSVTEIANYLFFSSDSHFCKAFKQVTGITPKQYRQKKYSFTEEYEQKVEG